jgi:uncharacterized membrane protein YciS (DUF1049 family)
MRTTPWAAYTPTMVLHLIGFVVVLLLVLFGLTLICVGGYFCARIAREYFRSKPFAVFEKKATAAIQAADLGWLAIVCGPLVPVLIVLPMLSISLFVRPADGSPLEVFQMLPIVFGVGAVAGVIAAGAFWISSALLGNVRKAAKRLRGVRDPEFDGPF